MKPRDITILGAGIAGLAAARGLAMRGWGVTVLEQAATLSEVGAGLQIAPNGAAVLRALGIPIDTIAMRGQAVELREGRRDRLVMRVDVSAQTYHLVHRADLIAALADAARDAGAAIVTGNRAEDAAGLVVGADGLHSVVRRSLNVDAPAFFTGHVAWRAIIAGDGGPPVSEIHTGAGKHLVTYPLRNGALRNIVAVEERTSWAEESWTLRDESDAMHRAFAGFSPRVRGWLSQVERPFLWGLFRHPVAARWHDDRRAIIGDAAHPTLPFMAQGANLALEDAWVLADCLERGDDFGTAAAACQGLREGRVRKVVQTASGNARIYHLPPIVDRIAHLGMRALSAIAPEAPLSKFDWIYRHDVTR